MDVCDYCGKVELDDNLTQCHMCQLDACEEEREEIQGITVCNRCNIRYFTETAEIESIT